jgi:hypothetical protein
MITLTHRPTQQNIFFKSSVSPRSIACFSISFRQSFFFFLEWRSAKVCREFGIHRGPGRDTLNKFSSRNQSDLKFEFEFGANFCERKHSKQFPFDEVWLGFRLSKKRKYLRACVNPVPRDFNLGTLNLFDLLYVWIMPTVAMSKYYLATETSKVCLHEQWNSCRAMSHEVARHNFVVSVSTP